MTTKNTLPNPLNYDIYRGDPLPRPNLYGYALAGQGVIKHTNNSHFNAAVVAASGQITGLPIYPVGITLYHPPIPCHWLVTVLDHARRASSDHLIARPVESLYHFHWVDFEWRVAVPKQIATPDRVDYKVNPQPTLALELHSHVDMPAGFSLTDDTDQQGAILYATIGRIFSRPEIRLRVGIYGNWQEIDPDIVFESLGPFIWSYR